MTFEMRGLQGQLKYGYQQAARLGPWLFVDGRVEAAIFEKHPLWFDLRPLGLWLDVGRKYWVWRETEILSVDGMLTCRVSGNPEVRGAR